MINVAKTITFREIVRLIHPDTNPNIVDSSTKMKNAVLFRNDEEALYRMGVTWGVIHNTVKPPVKKVGMGVGDPTRVSPITGQPYVQQPCKRYVRKPATRIRGRVFGLNKKPTVKKPITEWNTKGISSVIMQGDTIYIKSIKKVGFCTKVTPKRVYFRLLDGINSFALKRNVMRVSI